jgi:hypothetical protein
MRTLGIALLLGCSILLAVACDTTVTPGQAGSTTGGGNAAGGNGGGGGTCAPTDAPVTADDFEQRLTTAFCGGIAPCCKSDGLGFDEKNCAERIGQLIRSISPTKPENGAFDPVKGQACVDDACQATRSCPESRDSALAFVTNCNAVFTGKAPPGTPCGRDVDCAPPEGDGLGVCNLTGVCSQFARGKAGDACVMSYEVVYQPNGESEGGEQTTNPPATSGTLCDAADGLLCDLNALYGPTPKCVALGSAGDPCVNDDDCGAGLDCPKADPDQPKGKCAAKTAIGGGCDPESVNRCAAGAFCDDTTKRCAAQADVGGRCQHDAACKTGVCKSGKCDDYFVNVDVCTGH